MMPRTGNWISPLAGKPATPAMRLDVPALLTAYFSNLPDVSLPEQQVEFGFAGHRGRPQQCTFNEAHVLSISQAICDCRRMQGIDGPLFLGMDTHALSVPATAGALEVLAANGVDVMLAARDEYTPTPVVAHAVRGHNRGRRARLADGIVVTPSHNPPDHGGLRYQSPGGGPAAAALNHWIGARSNALLRARLQGVKRMPLARARRGATTHRHDFLDAYVGDLGSVLDMDAIRRAGLRLGVDPMGGAGVHYWGPIAERYGLNLEIVCDAVDPTFQFMSVDWDGQIRMDPGSQYAMRRLIDRREGFDVGFACDTDHDRHGIVTRRGGLMPADQYLSVARFYLLQQRPHAVALASGCNGAAPGVLRRDGTVWTTQGDAIVPALLSAEITARMGRDLAEIYRSVWQDSSAAKLAPAPLSGRGAAEHDGVLAHFNAHELEAILSVYGQRNSGSGHLRRIVAGAQVFIDAALVAATPGVATPDVAIPGVAIPGVAD